MKNRSINTVIFDAGGTLIGPNDPDPFYRFLLANAPADFAAPSIEAACELMKAIQLAYDITVAKHFENGGDLDIVGDLWRKAFHVVWNGQDNIADTMFDWFIRGEFDTLYRDVHPTLETLKTHSIRMGILSNFAPTLKNRLRELGIYDFFDFFVVSSEVGLSKPDPSIFNLAIELSNCPKECILYVGDNPQTDIEPALAVKIHALLIDRAGKWSFAHYERLRNLIDILDFI